MKYRYNLAFLPKWMKENGITSTELLETMGTQDYATLRRWITGKGIIKFDALLCLCNAYNIPISCFLVNKETCNDFAVPTQEYDDNIDMPLEDKKRGVNPYRDKKIDTMLPGRWKKLYAENILKGIKDDSTKEDIIKQSLDSKYNIKINKLTEKYQKELEKLDKKYKKQIVDKDKTINSLSNTLSNLTSKKSFSLQQAEDNKQETI